MRVGIPGSGLMGGELGTIFSRAGHDVVFSYARSKDKLRRLAREAGGDAHAGTPTEAAKDADALLFAVHWSRIDDVLHQAGDLTGKVIVTCSLPRIPAILDSSPLTRPLASRSLQERSRTHGWSVLSIPCRARCSSAYLKAGTRATGQIWCIMAMTRPLERLPPS